MFFKSEKYFLTVRVWIFLFLVLVVFSSGCTSDFSESEEEIRNEESFEDVNFSEPESVAKYHIKIVESMNPEKALVLTHERSKLRKKTKKDIENLNKEQISRILSEAKSKFGDYNVDVQGTRELKISNHLYKIDKVNTTEEFKTEIENELDYNISMDELAMIDVVADMETQLEEDPKGGLTYIMAQEKDDKEWKILETIVRPTRVGKGSNPDRKVKLIADFKFPERNEVQEGGLKPEKIEIEKGEQIQVELISEKKDEHRLEVPVKYISTDKTNTSTYLHFEFNQTGKYKFGVETGHFLSCYSFIRDDGFTDNCLEDRTRTGTIIVN